MLLICSPLKNENKSKDFKAPRTRYVVWEFHHRIFLEGPWVLVIPPTKLPKWRPRRKLRNFKTNRTLFTCSQSLHAVWELDTRAFCKRMNVSQLISVTVRGWRGGACSWKAKSAAAGVASRRSVWPRPCQIPIRPPSRLGEHRPASEMADSRKARLESHSDRKSKTRSLTKFLCFSFAILYIKLVKMI